MKKRRLLLKRQIRNLESRIRNLEDIEAMQKRMYRDLERENLSVKMKMQRYNDHMYLLQAFIREATHVD